MFNRGSGSKIRDHFYSSLSGTDAPSDNGTGRGVGDAQLESAGGAACSGFAEGAGAVSATTGFGPDAAGTEEAVIRVLLLGALAFDVGAAIAAALAVFFGAAVFGTAFLANFLADFFAAFAAGFFADFFAGAFTDFLAVFFLAVFVFAVFLFAVFFFVVFFFDVTAFVVFLLFAFLLFAPLLLAFLPLAIVLSLLVVKCPLRAQFNPGRGPPVAQSRSSTVCTTGTDVPLAICTMHPILPAAIMSGFTDAMLATFRSRN